MQVKDYCAEFGKRVKEAREMRHVSQCDLASKLNTKQSAVSRMEGGRHDPKLSTILKVAEALGVGPEDLVG